MTFPFHCICDINIRVSYGSYDIWQSWHDNWQFYFWSLYQFLKYVRLQPSTGWLACLSRPTDTFKLIWTNKGNVRSSVTSVPQTHLSVRVEPDTRRESKNNDNVEKIHSEITCIMRMRVIRFFMKWTKFYLENVSWVWLLAIDCVSDTALCLSSYSSASAKMSLNFHFNYIFMIDITCADLCLWRWSPRLSCGMS